MPRIHGFHHITAIAGPAQQNLDFYAGILGMRLVKRSVNQDDPGTYHLFYADGAGHPGTDLTFFPWPQLAPARLGHGHAVEVALAVPPGSLDFWRERLAAHRVEPGEPEERFGARALPLADPHGLRLALVEEPPEARQLFAPWDGSPVPPERQVRGLYGARVWEASLTVTERFVAEALGLERLATDGGWVRFGVPDGPGFLDVREVRDVRRGAWGTGGVHHLAWRVTDDEEQLAVRARVEGAGSPPTPVIDRFWFRSVYFREPGGVLFELATDGPGFAVDEAPERLGETLVLPPWLEPVRDRIEAALPELALPG